jgi:hypothetical protein
VVKRVQALMRADQEKDTELLLTFHGAAVAAFGANYE